MYRHLLNLTYPYTIKLVFNGHLWVRGRIAWWQVTIYLKSFDPDLYFRSIIITILLLPLKSGAHFVMLQCFYSDLPLFSSSFIDLISYLLLSITYREHLESYLPLKSRMKTDLLNTVDLIQWEKLLSGHSPH